MENTTSDLAHAGGDRSSRYLIVNADDFGRTAGLNRGIIESHERGIVTSATLMVHYPAAAEAGDYARAHPDFSVGLHFDLYEWEYDRQSGWISVYERVDHEDPAAIRTELDRQLALFERLAGQPPSHLDSHQHAHLSEPARAVVLETAERHRLSVRNSTPGIGYCGDFYGQTGRGEPYPDGISIEQLVRTIEALPEGWTELSCHPGYAGDMKTIYAAEREQELRTLCSPEVVRAIAAAGVQLCSFRDFRRSRSSGVGIMSS